MEYLGFDDLNVVNEGVVYDAAIRWVKYDLEERMPFAAIVIGICFSVMYVRLIENINSFPFSS